MPIWAEIGVWRHGKRLVMHRQAQLPDRCVKTNAPAEVWLRKKLFWYHPAILLGLLVNLLVFIVLVCVLGKSARIRVGVSRQWYVRHLWRTAIAWTVTLLATAGCAAAGAFLLDSTDWGGWLFLAALFVFVFGGISTVYATRSVWPAQITDRYVVMKGVHPAFLAELPVWPYHTGYVP